MIESLSYYWGLFDAPKRASADAAAKRVRFDSSFIPENVSKSFEDEQIADLSGQFGDAGAGSPTEIDHLEYQFEGKTRTIRVVNRGISIFLRETPELLRLHRFFCVLQTYSQDAKASR